MESNPTMTHVRTIGYSISWICGRIHVGTPYSEVADDFNRRCRAGKIVGTDRARAITDAVIQHRRNRADYAWVMGPH